MPPDSDNAAPPPNYLTQIPFRTLPLHEALMRGLDAAGFSTCTRIQAEALPVALSGRDVAGQAQTGTGKTAAYLLALMDRLLRSTPSAKRAANQPRAVVLAPTRELAIQIHKDALQLGQCTALTFGLIYGGIDYEKQRNTLREGVDVLIGTPGRIIDYFRQHVFDMREVEVVVLDEADRMFDLGFIKDIRFLLRRMPPPERRLGMLFSATLSWRVTELAYEHMNNPVAVMIEPDRRTADAVRQTLYHVEGREKLRVLLGLLRQQAPTRVLVFVNTKRAAEYVGEALSRRGYVAAALSGDVPQQRRQKLIARFAKGELPILVATDVAARGLHIPDVTHVVNFDLPQNAEDYVHRIGRTARAGASGDALSLACEQYVYSLLDIEQYIGRKLPVAQVTPELLALGEQRPAPAVDATAGDGESTGSAPSPARPPRRRRRRSPGRANGPGTPVPATDA